MKEFGPGCQRPKGQPRPVVETEVVQEVKKGDERKMIQVGKPAPLFDRARVLPRQVRGGGSGGIQGQLDDALLLPR